MLALTARRGLVVTTRQVQFSVKYLDSLGVEIAVPYYATADDTKTMALAISEFQQMLDDLDAVTDAQITGASINIVNILPTAGKSSPVAGSLVNRGELLNFSQTGNPRRQEWLIPAIALSKLSGGRLNLADADVSSLIDLITAVGTVFRYTSTVFAALVALLDAFLSIRKHRKPDTKVSFEVP